jgi:hypothetical protein
MTWGLIFVLSLLRYIAISLNINIFCASDKGETLFLGVFIMYIIESSIICFSRSIRMLNVKFFVDIIVLLAIICLTMLVFMILFIFEIPDYEMIFFIISGILLLFIIIVDALKCFSSKISQAILCVSFYVVNGAFFMSWLRL